MIKARAATVLMSGGIDSAACAYYLRAQGFSVDGLFIDHGQAATRRESRAVSAMAEHLSMPLRMLSVAGLEASGSGELIGRNAFLIFTALFAIRGRAGLLGIGLHAGTPYYDCSEAFVAAAGKLVAEHSDGKVVVVAPFVNWTKKNIHSYFVSAGLPIESTYSCEAGTVPTCGACASCRDRKALGC